MGQEIGWECGFAIIALASGIIRAAHYRAGYLVSFHRIRSDFFDPTHLLFRFQLSSLTALASRQAVQPYGLQLRCSLTRIFPDACFSFFPFLTQRLCASPLPFPAFLSALFLFWLGHRRGDVSSAFEFHDLITQEGGPFVFELS